MRNTNSKMVTRMKWPHVLKMVKTIDFSCDSPRMQFAASCNIFVPTSQMINSFPAPPLRISSTTVRTITNTKHTLAIKWTLHCQNFFSSNIGDGLHTSGGTTTTSFNASSRVLTTRVDAMISSQLSSNALDFLLFLLNFRDDDSLLLT